MFRPNALYYSDGYKIGHQAMAAPGTDYLYGTWIPRGVKYAGPGIEKIVSFGQALTWRWVHDEFTENFFKQSKGVALKFVEDMNLYLGLEYDGTHYSELHDVGYLPVKVKALPEGIETLPNVPHMTFVNTKKGFAWLTLYLETIVSSLAWKPSNSATIALQYRRNVVDWVMKTDPSNSFLIDFMLHDFSARGLSPWDMLSSGLGHATSFRGSDTLIVIPAARYFYAEPEDEVCINSVKASEHSVSTTRIFSILQKLKDGGGEDIIKQYEDFDGSDEAERTDLYLREIAECQFFREMCMENPDGILSLVSDTFDLWIVVTKFLPRLKALIMSRNGKVVIRPDSGDPVDITTGYNSLSDYEIAEMKGPVLTDHPSYRGVIELLWDIFGGTVNEQGYKVLDSHIGSIYGDSINLERQIAIYSRLANKMFASTNIVLGIGSFTYQMNTRDTLGWAAKGAWFEIDGRGYDIFKDPATDDGSKRSLKGRIAVMMEAGEYVAKQGCTAEEEELGYLQPIYNNGRFYNMPSLTEVRDRILLLSAPVTETA